MSPAIYAPATMARAKGTPDGLRRPVADRTTFKQAADLPLARFYKRNPQLSGTMARLTVFPATLRSKRNNVAGRNSNSVATVPTVLAFMFQPIFSLVEGAFCNRVEHTLQQGRT